jgi:hypothetical protein
MHLNIRCSSAESQFLQADVILTNHRFLTDYPRWFQVLRACVAEAERTRGEFAGSWALRQAKKSGLDWFPNLRPLVSYEILRRTDVARGGRRAYYVMTDVKGVKAAVTELEQAIDEAAAEAVANAMYRYTFGIVGDARGGVEGRGLGTGVGLRWKNSYVIVTAAHTVQETPYERLYFLLPFMALKLVGSRISVEPAGIQISKRFQVENPQILLANQEDVAAVVLVEQVEERGRSHFYQIDSAGAEGSVGKQVGLLGYAGAARVSVGENFMATPYVSFGDLVDVPSGGDAESMVLVRYSTDQHINPAGLSGSGIWAVPKPQIVWRPEVYMMGLVTHHDANSQVLVGYRIEKVIEFLNREI